MDTKKKKIIIGSAIGAAAIVIVVVTCIIIFRGFDPQKYVSAVLDQTMKGEVRAATKMMVGSTEKELLAQYEAGITSFAKNSIAGGVSMEQELEDKYVALCKDIFAGMQYKVKSAKKTGNGKYEVTVEYRASDIIRRFVESTSEETARLSEKVENGEYRGTLEEINAQMQAEFLTNAYPLLESAYQSMEFGETKAVVLTVEKGESGLYELGKTDITEFLTKILGLDEIQD